MDIKDVRVLRGTISQMKKMKKIWVYMLGVLSGILLVFLFTLISNISNNSDITFFDEPGEIITVECFGRTKTVNSFKIFQTLGDKAGLAYGEGFCSSDLVVLFYDNTGQSLFDNQSIIATSGKCFRQIGIYKYKSKDKKYRTIPVVMLMDGNEIIEDNDIEKNKTQNTNYTFFDKPGEVMSDKSYKIDKVLAHGAAIAHGKSEYGSLYYGLEVLLWDETANFYDDQIIKATAGKCFRQIGIYKSNDLFNKTLPIVTLVDK